MTTLLNRTICKALLIAAFAVSFSILSTPSFAWNAETGRACIGDAWRLCSSTIPNISATEACMTKQRSSVSAGCKMAAEKDLASKRTRSVSVPR